MKNFKKKILILGVLLIALLCGTVFMYNRTVNHPIKSDKESIKVEVSDGEGFYTLLNELKEKDLIKNELFIKIYIKLNGSNVKVAPGTYTIKSNVTLKEFLEALEKQDTVKVVIPEGYTVDQIGDVLQKDGLFSKEEFLKAVKDYKLPSYIKKDSNRRYPLEGFLFPDTYIFRREVTPDEVIETMLSNFNKVFKEAEKETGIKVKESNIDEIVTRASVIEKEARSDKDRPLIASVINNRLNKNMPLQIDATVIYALGTHVDKVLYKHLEIDSPYNTYKYKGLPVGPISNPGKPSIIAALKPAKTNYLYYLLDPKTDDHYFTNNYSDFDKKKAEFGY